MIQRQRILLEAIVVVVVALLIGVIIAFNGYIRNPESNVPVIINEVYPAFLAADPAPHQWLELYNRTSDKRTLEGWSIETTADNRLALPTIVLPGKGFAIVAASRDQFLADNPNYPGILVSPSAGWTGMDVANGFVVLRDSQGNVVDFVNWGVVSKVQVPTDIPFWAPKDAKDQPIPVPFPAGAGWIFGKNSEGKTIMKVDNSLERRPVGMDTGKPSDFVRQPFISPGTVHPPSATRPAQALFTDWTNVASYAGGILLWIAFIYVALIARRFETLTQQRTFWQAMLVAPIGILVYNIIQALAFLDHGQMNDNEKLWGFSILFLSALLCLGLVWLFQQRAKGILEG